VTFTDRFLQITDKHRGGGGSDPYQLGTEIFRHFFLPLRVSARCFVMCRRMRLHDYCDC